MTGAFENDDVPAGQFGESATTGDWLAPVVGAVNHQHRAARATAQFFSGTTGRSGPPLSLGDHRLGIGLQRPAHGVLVLLRGM